MTSHFKIAFNIISLQGGAVALSAALKYPGEWRCKIVSQPQVTSSLKLPYIIFEIWLVVNMVSRPQVPFSVATLGGCVALSCYLPGGGNPSVSIQGLETPILQVHYSYS